MIDCHVHSKFSTDGEMTPETACEKALDIGLDGLIFTDHLDFDFPGANSYDNIDFSIYSQYMDNLKDQYKNKLSVLKGIEVGLQPHVLEASLKTVASVNFDYVLASVHIIGGIDPYCRDFYKRKSIKEAYELYLQEILHNITAFEDFDNTGHLEYITRYAGYDDRTLRYNNHTDILDQIFKELIGRGKGFEINTGSFRDKPGIVTAQYDAAVLKRYKELGGEIISLASDAHNPLYLGYKFNYFKDMLLDCGFSYVTHFENRKPVFTKL
ncbi:MAG: histidinol phosphate phosphatase [Clostridiales bacterium GWC2_40_7]|nr:MAG: histidinol phosphate phosphatase [Clostridiales bacterium GWC2_40_7]